MFVVFFLIHVRYLDWLDFGKMNVAESTPRVSVWNGNMVKVFSDLDRKCGKQFGKKHLKDRWLSGHHLKGLPSSHANGIPRISPIVSPLSCDFRAKARDQFVSSLQADVVDGILSIGDKFLSNKSSTSKKKLEVLVNNVLDLLCKSSYTHNRVDANQREPHESIVKRPHTTASNANMKHAPFVGESEVLQQNPAPTLHGVAKFIPSSSKRTPDPVTPECLITKVVEGRTHSTAPGMVPIRKVKARNINLISREDEQNMFNRRLISTTSKVTAQVIDVPESPRMKNVKDGEVHLVGSSDFRRRCSEVSKNVDNTYNNLLLPNQSNQQVVNGVSTAQENVQDADAQGTSKDGQDVPKCRVRRKYMFVNLLMTG